MPGNQYVTVVFSQVMNRQFTYRLPASLGEKPFIGQRVIAPLKQTTAVGFIVAFEDSPPSGVEIRDIIEIVDHQPVFPPELFSFLRRMAEYYLTPLAKVLSIAIPPEYRLIKNRRLSIMPTELTVERYNDIYATIAAQPDVSLANLRKKFDQTYLEKGIAYLKQRHLIRELPVYTRKKGENLVLHAITLTPAAQMQADLLSKFTRAPRQRAVLEQLIQAGGTISGAAARQISAPLIRSLSQKGLVACEYQREDLDDFWSEFSTRPKTITLTDDQQAIFEPIQAALREQKYAAFLIEGVTGSGKTEVYIKLIQEAIKAGRSAMVLVPEITLTSHLAGRFKGAFGSQIAIWHSHLTQKRRKIIWWSILQGEYPVVIGARSAIFLPLPNLGLIVVDEEQDSSFKQRSPEPRYQGRDAALLRGSLSNSVVVLGSATPSLETQYNAAVGKITKLVLPRRFAKAPTAKIHVVDMLAEYQQTGDFQNPLSRLLLEKIGEKVSLGQQVLLLQNRRGFSHVILCPDCGYVPLCRNCDITMTYHKKENRLQCHYCNFTLVPPASCPKCGGTRFLYPGVGTQKVENLLRSHFPNFNLSRLDIDTCQETGYAQRILKAFEQNQIQILLGTQMIAKGLDFPNVTLVGVINADVGLFMPDFRARERVFHLLYQVSGRAGRGELQGEIVIQTYNPHDFTIRCALQQNLTMFVNNELSERNPLHYPPFSRLALIQVSALQNERAQQVAQEVAFFLNQNRKQVYLLGPAPAPLSKIKNRYRYQIILKSRKEHDPSGTKLHNLLHTLLHSDQYPKWSRQARLSIDIDPADLL